MAEFANSFSLPAFQGQFDPQTCAEFRRKRLALGLSYCALGRFLGVHWSTIRKWENGLICQCSLHFRKRIAGFLRGDYDYDIQANLGDPRLGAYLRPVSAGAMAKFYFIEPSNMQAQRHDLEVRSLVPRIESVADEGAFSNLCDAKVSVKAGMRGDVFVSETAGRLASWKPGREVAHSDVPYRLVLPVRTAVADRVCLTTSSQPHAVDTARNGDAFSPVGGFLVRYMAFLPDGDGKSAIAVSLTRKLPRENCCKDENSLIKCISPLTCGNVIGYNTIDKFGEELCH